MRSLSNRHIYLKLGVCVHYPKGNPYYQGRQLKKNFFFNSELCPVFDLRLFILYQTPHSRALAPACGALVITLSFTSLFNNRLVVTYEYK